MDRPVTMGRRAASFIPILLMVSSEAAFAGLNLFSKLAMDAGMSPLVMVAYRQFFAAAVLAPVAYFAERSTWRSINWPILGQIFLCSLLGATLNQILYFLGLKLTNATVACALSNTLPAITFVMAACFRMEEIGLRTMPGLGKIVGTTLSVGGSMLMTFYKGPVLHMGSSGVHWSYAEDMDRAAAAGGGGEGINQLKMVIGSALIIGSCLARAAWFVIQSRMSNNSFASPYTTTTIMTLMAGVQCLLTAAVAERRAATWSLGWGMPLFATIYAGVLGSGFSFAAIAYCIQANGALYASIFSPLLLIFVAVLGWAVLDEKFYAGTVEGSALIVVGLYLVLWGKGKEEKAAKTTSDKENLQLEASSSVQRDIEMDQVEQAGNSRATAGV